MISRRSRVQEKKHTRKGIFLLFLSLILFVLLLIYGLSSIAKFASIITDLKGSSTPIVNEDKTPPAPPQLLDFPPEFTTTPEFLLKGRAEAGSNLTISKDGTKIKEMLIGDTSTFEYEIALQEGKNRISYTATDQAGNTSDSAGFNINYDISEPTIEIEKPKEGDSFVGVDRSIEVLGSTDKDAQLTVNNRLAIVGLDGKFSLKIRLGEGDNDIKFISQDKAGNKTEKTVKVIYTP